ncbi:MAG: hypothetical protein AVDCRST_MAG18-3716 [uncultured Thermomicrobiales bacterium]|uniref:Predicted membrane protein YciQ-like C-terminal domain-containing protein n=1 Tax=uncultured Thermomicrobiales bacterium TaxID=1645740 RepID=A0A6J4VQG1_9BACT|nr:MAG: hypothetical protein AVDCRST_MAG18-3716 [uncultured Thermomicrobiales bacterium]
MRVPLAQTASETFINLLLGELGLAILVGGGVGLLLLWYVRGRDRPHGLVAEYLREPPGDLHPGLIGTLLDEHANSHDIVATLINLGHRGVLRITAPGPGQPDYELALLRRDLPLARVERLLIELLFGTAARPFVQRVLLGDVRARFIAAIPRFKVALYEEVVAEGYFLASPRATRLRYRRWGATIMVLAPLLGISGAFLIPGLRLLLLPAATLTVIGVALYRLAKVMPAKTPSGVEATARWRAFRRYLEQIERYEDLETARGIFDRYLPYAIAFGLEKEWVGKFTRAHAAAPSWFDFSTPPLRAGRGGRGGNTYVGDLPSFGSSGSSGSSGSLSLPDMPDLGGVTDGLGGAAGAFGGLASNLPDLASDAGGAGLEAASDALAGLLDAASSIFDW